MTYLANCFPQLRSCDTMFGRQNTICDGLSAGSKLNKKLNKQIKREKLTGTGWCKACRIFIKKFASSHLCNVKFALFNVYLDGLNFIYTTFKTNTYFLYRKFPITQMACRKFSINSTLSPFPVIALHSWLKSKQQC